MTDLNQAAIAARFSLAEACGSLSLRTAVVATPGVDLNVIPGARETAVEAIAAIEAASADDLLLAIAAAYAALGYTAVIVREPEGLVYMNEARQALGEAKAALEA